MGHDPMLMRGNERCSKERMQTMTRLPDVTSVTVYGYYGSQHDI